MLEVLRDQNIALVSRAALFLVPKNELFCFQGGFGWMVKHGGLNLSVFVPKKGQLDLSSLVFGRTHVTVDITQRLWPACSSQGPQPG